MRSSNTSNTASLDGVMSAWASGNQALANSQQRASEQGAYLQQLRQTSAHHGLGQFYPLNPAPPSHDDEVTWLKRRVEEVMFR